MDEYTDYTLNLLTGGASAEYEYETPYSNSYVNISSQPPSAPQAVDLARPVQVAELDKHGIFQLKNDALQAILMNPKARDKPVAVLSVAGERRLGKSFLLNFCIRYMEADNKDAWMGDKDASLGGFAWDGGCKHVTNGIWMWSEPFVVRRKDGTDIAVLLMDTQGLYDNSSVSQDWSTIFAFSTLVSSIQVYNVSRQIHEGYLQSLQLFVNYAKQAWEGGDSRQPFQSLVFLVRDWPNPGNFTYGEDGGNEYLDSEVMKTAPLSREADSESTATSERDRHHQLISLRNDLKETFEKMSCFLMPKPGDAVELCRNENGRFTGKISEIKTEFMTFLDKFFTTNLSPDHVIVKKINKRPVTGRELYIYVTSFAQVFQSGKLPEAKSIFTMMTEANNKLAFERSLDHYRTKMSERFSDRCLTQPEIEQTHEDVLKEAHNMFVKERKMGGKQYSTNYWMINNSAISKIKDGLVSSNASKMTTVKKSFEHARDIYSKRMSKQCGDKALEIAEFEEIHNDVYTEIHDMFNSATGNIGGTDFCENFWEANSSAITRMKEIYLLENELNNAKAENDCQKRFEENACEDYRTRMWTAIKSREKRENEEIFKTCSKEAWYEARECYRSPDKVGGEAYSERYWDGKKAKFEKLEATVQRMRQDFQISVKDELRLAQSSHRAAFTNAYDEYNRRMRVECSGKKLKEQEIEKNHGVIYGEVLDKYNRIDKTGSGELINSETFWEDHKSALEGIKNRFISQARNRLLSALARASGEAYYDVVMIGKCADGSKYIQPELFERLHNDTVQKALDHFKNIPEEDDTIQEYKQKLVDHTVRKKAKYEDMNQKNKGSCVIL